MSPVGYMLMTLFKVKVICFSWAEAITILSNRDRLEIWKGLICLTFPEDTIVENALTQPWSATRTWWDTNSSNVLPFKFHSNLQNFRSWNWSSIVIDPVVSLPLSLKVATEQQWVFSFPFFLHISLCICNKKQQWAILIYPFTPFSHGCIQFIQII